MYKIRQMTSLIIPGNQPEAESHWFPLFKNNSDVLASLHKRSFREREHRLCKMLDCAGTGYNKLHFKQLRFVLNSAFVLKASFDPRKADIAQYCHRSKI